MLVVPGGRERTDREYNELLAAAGLKSIAARPTHSPFAIIES